MSGIRDLGPLRTIWAYSKIFSLCKYITNIVNIVKKLFIPTKVAITNKEKSQYDFCVIV